jgi:spore germination cell wall hydrolase CwlJ-like protein
MIQFSTGFAKQTKSDVKLTETECLAGAIYFEARGETVQGKLAVARVVMNRTITRINTVCGVLTEPGQFSGFTKSKVRETMKKNDPSWSEAYSIALHVMKTKYDRTKDITKGSQYFQVKTIPHDSRIYTVQTVIGNHKFLRHKSEKWS